MAKQSTSVRLEESTIEALDAYAQEHGITRTAAIEKLIRAGLQKDSDAPQDVPQRITDVLQQANADLRAALVDTRGVVATLTAQLAVKDRQIEAAHTLIDQAHRLHMAEVTRALPAPSIRDRITRWIHRDTGDAE